MIDTVVMDYGDYDVMLPPSTYCPGDEIRYVFAVPKDNMVGTNELDNAIKLLEFRNDEELKQHVVKKDFMEMVTGPFEFRFLPVWSNKEIAYSQSKGFLLVNIPDKKVEIHTISPGMYAGDIGPQLVGDRIAGPGGPCAGCCHAVDAVHCRSGVPGHVYRRLCHC